MKTQAAVLCELGKPLELMNMDVPPLKPGQVLAKLAYSGVCHTQLLEARGHRGADRFLPHCLGHEGSGWVVDVAPGVQKVKPGDAVVLSWLQGSGATVHGTAYQVGSRAINAGAVTTFQELAVVSESRVTTIPKTMDMRYAALLGCALPTGAGAVFNTLKARPGSTMAVFGAGGVGLCAIMAARAAGCTTIVAIDMLPWKLKLAADMGATHSIDASKEDVAGALSKLCPGGVDFAVEASGAVEAMHLAISSVRLRSGATALVGNARFGQRLDLDPMSLIGRKVTGSWGGECEPDADFPRLCRLIEVGRFNLDPLLSRIYPLAEANAALTDLEKGEVARPLIKIGAE